MDAAATVEKETVDAMCTLKRDRAFVSLEEGRQAAKDIRAASQAAGMAEMTMEEIDAVIAECRREWRQSVSQ